MPQARSCSPYEKADEKANEKAARLVVVSMNHARRRSLITRHPPLFTSYYLMHLLIKKTALLTVSLALWLSVSSGSASAADLTEARTVLQQWMEKASKVSSVEAEVEQHRLLSTVRIPLRRPGKLWMDSSGLFRWQIGEPPVTTVIRDKEGRLVVLDGKAKTASVWSREALLEEEAEGRGQGFAMLQSMQTPSMDDFEKRFELKDAEKLEDQSNSNQDIWLFEMALRDRKASVFVRRIQLTVNATNGTLISMSMIMRDKSSLTTYVRSHRLNGKIPASIFEVDTTGYEVTQQR